MDITALQTEITSGPLSASLSDFVTSGNDGAIAAVLNADYATETGAISRAMFAIWAAQTGMRSAIRDHTNTVESPLRSIAISLEDFLGGASDTLDFAKPENQTMLAAWVAAGGCTQEQADSLIALCQKPVSRAQQAFGAAVNHLDVAKALRGN
jgi:hypothetical protein